MGKLGWSQGQEGYLQDNPRGLQSKGPNGTRHREPGLDKNFPTMTVVQKHEAVSLLTLKVVKLTP